MMVRFQQPQDDAQFKTFNESVFPERGDRNRALTELRYFNSKNPQSDTSGNVVAFTPEGKLIGQALYHKTDFFHDGQRRSSEWGFDFFVVPEHRNDFVGVDILQYVKANKAFVFAVGLGEKALKLQKMLGYHVIGEIRKYVKIVQPLCLPFGLLRSGNLEAARYPKSVKKGTVLFDRVSAESLWDAESPYNQELLEFGRDRSFLNWRFYSDNFQYAVYRKADGTDQPNYFALRSVKIKGVTGLVLADFRYQVSRPEQFREIVDAARQIASKMWLPILATGSAHRSSDQVLEAMNFKKVGRDRPVVSNDKAYKQFKPSIDDRNFVFVTLADSDGEYLM